MQDRPACFFLLYGSTITRKGRAASTRKPQSRRGEKAQKWITAAYGFIEHPCIVAGRKTVAQLCHTNFTQFPCLNSLLHLQNSRQKQHFLRLHHKQALFPRQSKQLPGMFRGCGAGLFANYMLAHFQRHFCQGVVLGIHRGNIDRIHIFVFQQFSMGAVGLGDIPLGRLQFCLFQRTGGHCHNIPRAGRAHRRDKTRRDRRCAQYAVT